MQNPLFVFQPVVSTFTAPLIFQLHERCQNKSGMTVSLVMPEKIERNDKRKMRTPLPYFRFNNH